MVQFVSLVRGLPVKRGVNLLRDILHLEWKPEDADLTTTTNPKVYVETTVISYLTARPSRDVIVAGHQQITHDWWQNCHERFDLVASQLVKQEASGGDPEAAQERLHVLKR